MENVDEYSSQDFYISCIILATKKLPLLRLERINSKLVSFVFSDPNCIAPQIIKDHWDRTNKIPSRDLIESINELKTRIHSGV